MEVAPGLRRFKMQVPAVLMQTCDTFALMTPARNSLKLLLMGWCPCFMGFSDGLSFGFVLTHSL